ncbi:MAG: AAA family ATPase, partial [Polyangiaceae bacterium]
ILVISAMLVGRGTIYDWVFSTCWVAAIPVLLVLVRWWRAVIFLRTEQVRKASRIQRWVLAHRQGWESFVAAAAGGAHLFASGTARGARNWLGRFVLTRRVLAYLFRRQLGKLGEQKNIVGSISASAFEALGPERRPEGRIATDSDDALERLAARIRERRGGVVALVGEQGMGKTSALERFRNEVGDVLLVDAPSGGDLTALRARFAEGLGLQLSPEASIEDAAVALARSPAHALLLDDAHRFVKPVMGGLIDFDALVGAASRHASTATWVFALDDVIWQFLSRARGGRPLFDEVVRIERWTEAQIVNLLQTRTKEADLVPSFEHLLDPLPATADEIDKHEALAQRASDYFRLLWDAALGNPGAALDMWRRSLGTDTGGKTAVRVFSAPDTTDLERLPDAAIFVLRAVLQLAPASAARIVNGTMLDPADVADALRHAVARGYIEERDGGGYRVTWTWFRTVKTFLQR